MDPLLIATPSEASIGAALRLWPELRGKRIRPLLVSAFGDIYVETSAGDVWVAQPLELACEAVASSVDEVNVVSSLSTRPGNRTVTSWNSQPLPSGSLNDAYE